MNSASSFVCQNCRTVLIYHCLLEFHFSYRFCPCSKLSFLIMKTVFLLLLVAATLAAVYPTPGKNVLVILEDMDYQQTHSQFFFNLKSTRNLYCFYSCRPWV